MTTNLIRATACHALVAWTILVAISTAASRADRLPTTQPKFADPPDHQPLTNREATIVRSRLAMLRDHAIRRDRAAEWDADATTLGDKTMRLRKRIVPGDAPAAGRPLVVSLHGGGGAPARVNDQQWSNQHKLYDFPPGTLVVAPRAPTDDWDLWHQPHIDPMLDRLIENAVAFEGVDRDRVYLVGYSAGGDGVYQLAPRLADRFAAASMSAGHPNDASPQSLRNLPFAISMGALDAAYDRNKVAAEWGGKLDELHSADPDGYAHLTTIHAGLGHWMKLADQAAVTWMTRFTRDPLPTKIVWKQDDVTRDSLYWLAVPKGSAKAGAHVVASRAGQTIRIERAELIDQLVVHFSDAMIDLDKPVTILGPGGETLFAGVAPRTLATIRATLEARGDPRLTFDAAVEVDIPVGARLASPASPRNGTITTTSPATTRATQASPLRQGDIDAAVAELRHRLPARDRATTDERLVAEARAALAARAATPWAAAVPRELFDEYVLPFWNLDEARDEWRDALTPIARELTRDATDCGDAAVKLNAGLWDRVGVRYHPTKRPRPNQSPAESAACGFASCTGLSVLLVDACRAVGVPARVVGIADWRVPAGPTFRGGGGNHTWVEVWDGRQWRFVGAAEPGPLDATWFADKATAAESAKREHAIFAAAAPPTRDAGRIDANVPDTSFPLVWSPTDRTVPAIDVTGYYARRVTARIDLPADAPAGATLVIRDAGRLVASGPPGAFLLAGGRTYVVEAYVDGTAVARTEHAVP